MTNFPLPIARLLAGDAWKHRVLAPEIAQSGELGRAIGILRGRFPEASADAPESSPVFLLSAGWGSGSTLVQRLIVSGGEAMIWGEPHDHGVPIPRLAQMLIPISDRWPRNSYFRSPHSQDELQNQWIANLSPDPGYLCKAHRAFLAAWLEQPAIESGRTRWGLKEVRLTADHACYLQWLYPNAKFVFLFRDVLDSYRSCKGVKWLSVWPDYPVDRPSAFAHHWRHLLHGFLDIAAELDALVIKYEDLVSGDFDVQGIAQHLELGTLDESILEQRLGARGQKKNRLRYGEMATIRAITDPLRTRVGYE